MCSRTEFVWFSPMDSKAVNGCFLVLVSLPPAFISTNNTCRLSCNWINWLCNIVSKTGKKNAYSFPELPSLDSEGCTKRIGPAAEDGLRDCEEL